MTEHFPNCHEQPLCIFARAWVEPNGGQGQVMHRCIIAGLEGKPLRLRLHGLQAPFSSDLKDGDPFRDQMDDEMESAE